MSITVTIEMSVPETRVTGTGANAGFNPKPRTYVANRVRCETMDGKNFVLHWGGMNANYRPLQGGFNSNDEALKPHRDEAINRCRRAFNAAQVDGR